MSSPPGTFDLDTIIEDMTEAIERDPADSDAYFRRGNARSNKRQYVEAREDMQMVIMLDPANAMAHNNLGVANLCLGDFEAAAQNTSAAIELDSEYRDAFHNRGLARSETGEPGICARRLRPRYRAGSRLLARLPTPQCR